MVVWCVLEARTGALSKPFYSQKISEEFERRKNKNSRYSLRAFARYLGLNPGTLSQVLSGQRGIPEYQASGLCEKLGLNESETAEFMQSLDPKIHALEDSPLICAEELQPILEEWEYFVILGTLRLKDFESSSPWISSKTDIPVIRVEECISYLMGLGLVVKDEQGRWVRAHKSLRSTHDIPSHSIRASHLSNIELSQQKLCLPVDKRDYSFSTVALDQKSFLKLKKMTLKFRNELFNLAESSSAETLYRVSIQCFPLTKE